MSSRDAILARLRALPREAPPPQPAYRPAPVDDLSRAFAARAEAVFATTERLGDLAHLPATVARYLAAHDLPPEAAIATDLAALDWAAAGIAANAAPGRASMAASVARAPAASAETGSLLLSSRDPHGPWPNLLADTHIAVLNAADIAASFEQAVARLFGNRPPRSLHTVTGPSRTGDIEQTLELGAHGAIRLHIVILSPKDAP